MDKDANALRVLISEEKFDEVLSLISGIEDARRLTISELILKGSSVQLSLGVGTPPLSEAERAYLDALEQDNEYVPALIELGWFYYAVEDDAKRALPLFERAIAVGLEQLREAIKGKRDCVEELQLGEVSAASIMKTAFVLHHAREGEDGDEDVKLIGVYSSKERAERVVESYRGLPGFAEHPEGFSISAYEIDKDHWTEGFVDLSNS